MIETWYLQERRYQCWDLFRKCIVCEFLIRGYLDSTGTLESYRYGDCQVVRVKGGSYDWATVWKRIDWIRLYGLTLSYKFEMTHLGWELCGFPSWESYDRCRPLNLIQCMSLPEVQSSVFVCESIYIYDMSYCRDVIMVMWCMRWIMKGWCVVVWLGYKFNL